MLSVRPAGSAEASDAAAVAAELSHIPQGMAEAIEDSGVEVVACRGHVLDAGLSLTTAAPEDWPPGFTWRDVPGVYSPVDRAVIIAVWDQGDGQGPHVPRPGERHALWGSGHGSLNLAAHETIHGYDYSHWPLLRSCDPAFRSAWRRDRDSGALTAALQTPTYFTDPVNGPREAFGESAARLFGLDQSEAGDWAELSRFWTPFRQVQPAQCELAFDGERIDSIGWARVLEDGSIQMDLLAMGAIDASGMPEAIGHARLVVSADDPRNFDIRGRVEAQGLERRGAYMNVPPFR